MIKKNKRIRAFKHKSKILLLLIIAFALIYSCRKQEYLSDSDIQADMIEEAKLLYEKTASGTISKTSNIDKNGNKKQTYGKTTTFTNFKKNLFNKGHLDWKNTSIKNTRVGAALRVPITYPDRTMITIKEAEQTYFLTELSYALFYKDSEDELHFEVVTSIPDKDYFENPTKSKQTFSGIVVIEDWFGKQLRAYRYLKNHVLLNSSNSESNEDLIMIRGGYTICAGPFDQDTEGEPVCTEHGSDSGGSDPNNPPVYEPPGEPNGGGGDSGGNTGDDTVDHPGPDDVVEEPEEKRPCSSANELAHAILKIKIDELKTTLSENIEKGFYFRENTGLYVATNVSGTENTASIQYDPSPTAPIDGFIHTHYNGGTLRVFSPSDIVKLTQWYKSGGIAHYDPSKFTMALVTSDGVYTLGVKSLNKFGIFTNSNSPGALLQLLESWYLLYKITPSTGEDLSLMKLAAILDKLNSGLVITKAANEYLTRWKVYDVDPDNNNDVKVTECED